MSKNKKLTIKILDASNKIYKNKKSKSNYIDLTNIIRDFSFTYQDLYEAFTAGDTEDMRKYNDEVNKEEFEEWFINWFMKKYD